MNLSKSRQMSARAAKFLSAVSVGVLAAQSAYAQDAGPADTAAVETVADEIIVSGFRASLEGALNVKRGSITPVDAILAEDIADFPDLNLAESIQRIPGVAIDRDGGEGRTITVRGLNANFTRVRINGLETLSTTGGTDSSGGTNRGRGFDFNIFASELFQSIKVSKAPTPDQEEGSLGAIVDLQTARPISYGKFVLSLNAQGQYNSVAKKINPRFSGLISNVWGDDEFGALFSFAYTKRDIIEEGFSSVRWDNAGAFSNEAAFPGVANAFHPRIPRYGVLTSDQERIGLTLALEARPAEGTEINVDALYSKFSGSRREQFLEAISFSRAVASGKTATDIVALNIDTATNNIVAGTFNDVDVRIENRLDILETEFKQLSIGIKQQLSDTFRVSITGGVSESDFKNPIQTTIIADRIDVDGYSYDFTGNRNLPAINYGFDVTNPNNFLITELRDRPQGVTNTFDTVAWDADWDATDTVTISTGFSYKKFGYDSTEARRDRILPFGAIVAFPLTTATSSLVNFGQGLGQPSGVNTSFVVPDITSIAAATGLYTGAFPAIPFSGSIQAVGETDYAGYLQGQINTELAGMKFRAVGGVRYIETNTESTGVLSGRTVTVPNQYEDWLPSLAITLEPADGLILRASAQKVMARPTLNSLTPGGVLNAFSETLSFGNPQLLPFRAKAYDLGIDWYFSDEGLFSVGLFYKDIGAFVSRQTDEVRFGDLGLDPALLNGSPSTVDTIFDVSRNVNGQGGNLKGFEVQLQTPFTFLPGILSNFGITTNYTYVKSEVNYGTVAVPLLADLTQLSRHSANGTLYYEDSKFSARGSVSYRSSYLQTVPGRNGADVEGKRSTFNVDAAVSYAITDKIKVSIEGINLTDQFDSQYVDSVGDRTSNYTHTGRTVTAGIRVNF